MVLCVCVSVFWFGCFQSFKSTFIPLAAEDSQCCVESSRYIQLIPFPWGRKIGALPYALANVVVLSK